MLPIQLVSYKSAIMPFAQLVVGPPGAGKSTYCNGMQQFMGAIGRKASIVNLDPANDLTSYDAALDVRELITLESIMQDDQLGPNGSVLYALEELEHNMEWLTERLKELGEDYILFDCPGQVELFTHHDSLRRIFMALQKMGYRVRTVRTTTSITLLDEWGVLPLLLLLLLALRISGETVADRLIVSRSKSHRFLRPHASLIVHREPLTVATNYAPNGPDTNQCPDQD